MSRCHHAGALPGHHGRRCGCGRSPSDQSVPPVDARGGEECTGVGLVAGEVTIGEHLPVNGRQHRSQCGLDLGSPCQ